MNEQVNHFEKCLLTFSVLQAWLTWLFIPLDTPGSILHLRVCLGISESSKQTTIFALLCKMLPYTWMSQRSPSVCWRYTWRSHLAVLNTSETETFPSKAPCAAYAVLEHALITEVHLVISTRSCSRPLTLCNVPHQLEWQLDSQGWSQHPLCCRYSTGTKT